MQDMEGVTVMVTSRFFGMQSKDSALAFNRIPSITLGMFIRLISILDHDRQTDIRAWTVFN
jgi:hypothetical protein